MPTISQIPVVDLTNAEFSNPAQASSYYPANNQNTHIHMGVPTQADGHVANQNNVFVTFISFKVNGQVIGNLSRCASGYFDSNTFPQATPQNFRNVLENLDLLVAGCG